MATEQEKTPLVQVLSNRPVAPGEAEALRVSLDFLPEAALIFGIDGTVLQANAPALSLFEATKEELIGGNIYSLASIEPEKTRKVSAYVGRGATIRFEMDFLTLKGKRRRVETINMPVAATGGKVVGVIGFARDISERSQAERERALMAAIVESSGDAIISLNLDEMITSWNRRAEEILGFTEADAIGQPLLIIIPPEMRTRESHGRRDQGQSRPRDQLRGACDEKGRQPD
jgi:PAS domain S-box-containing protein